VIEKFQNIIGIFISDVQTMALQHVLIGAFVTGVCFKISGWFENNFLRFLALIFGAMLFSELPDANNSIMHNFQFFTALGIVLPHLPFMFEYIQDKYYQLKYATVNAYYFWLTVYYKTINLFKNIIWFIVTLFNLSVWVFYTLKNTLLIIIFSFQALGEKFGGSSEYKNRGKLSDYWQWYKDNWNYQTEQREQAKYEYRDWYKGTKFYYEEYAWKWDDAKSQQSHRNDSSSKKQHHQDDSYYRQQEEKQQRERRAYEEQQKQQQQNHSKQEESKSYQNNQNTKQEHSYGSEYDRFFSGDDYMILGVSKNATMEEIKKAYHTVLKKYHPDKNLENKELFNKIAQQINAAFDNLKKKHG
jgi:hypothetical protein